MTLRCRETSQSLALAHMGIGSVALTALLSPLRQRLRNGHLQSPGQSWGPSSRQVVKCIQGLLGDGCVTLQDPAVGKNPHAVPFHRAPSQHQRFVLG